MLSANWIWHRQLEVALIPVVVIQVVIQVTVIRTYPVFTNIFLLFPSNGKIL